jgi:hypothetical protein
MNFFTLLSLAMKLDAFPRHWMSGIKSIFLPACKHVQKKKHDNNNNSNSSSSSNNNNNDDDDDDDDD